MNEATTWRLVVEYGPRNEEIGAVQLTATEEVADEAARALLRVVSDALRAQGAEYGCSVRMDRVALGRRVEG